MYRLDCGPHRADCWKAQVSFHSHAYEHMFMHAPVNFFKLQFYKYYCPMEFIKCNKYFDFALTFVRHKVKTLHRHNNRYSAQRKVCKMDRLERDAQQTNISPQHYCFC